MRLHLLFTTFPQRTETFLQREVEALLQADRDLELWSLWGGDDAFQGRPIHRVSLWQLFKLLLALPYWFFQTPRRFAQVLRTLLQLRWRNATNFWENVLGFGYGFILARRFQSVAGPDAVIHAVWASLPATVGLTIHQLTGIRFTFAGHAYDLFEDGGDALLPAKLAAASGLRTSTEAGVRRFHELGAAGESLICIRRGFAELPAFSPRPRLTQPLRLAAVGRFVEKMGYPLLADSLDLLQAQGLDFSIHIIGEGPAQKTFSQRARKATWSERVTLLGAQPFSVVLDLLRQSDVLLFTGVKAQNGDQAGFPNILAEAMAVGCSVIATPVGGVAEVIKSGLNGYLAETPAEVYRSLRALQTDEAARLEQLQAARYWVETNFDAHLNMHRFYEFLQSRCPDSQGLHSSDGVL